MTVGKAANAEWDLEALTPTFIESEHQAYVDAIVGAIENPRIRNIALSGNYGVGKSSILQEVSRLKGDDVVELSLSTLAPIEHSALDNSVPAQATTPTNRIQQEIVKQLLYREEPESAKGSRFRRIERFRPAREIVLAALAGIVFTFVFLIAGWGTTIARTLKPLAEIGLWVYPGIFLLSAGLVYFSRWMLHGKIHIKQFSAGPAAVTLDEKSVSYFDQYLDEIVYFFETSKHRIVIFEDIDRFNNSHIFETLRSLNTLLNAAPQVGNRPVRFIYAIKDSIFDRIGLELEGRKADATIADLKDPAQAESVRANRTKFFDLVIPVVPFITHRSARNLTTQILRGIDHDVSDDLIDLAGRFVPDMRLLKNVRNEFIVFRDRIFSGDGERLELSQTALFAMMLYKSTHLGDFEAIRLGKSNLDRLYEASRTLVVANIARIEREIRTARQQLMHAGSATSRAEKLGDKLIERLNLMIRVAHLQRANERYQYGGSTRTSDYFRTEAFWKAFVEEDGTSPVVWRNPSYGGQISLAPTDVAALIGETLDPETWTEIDREAANEKIIELQEQLTFLRSADMGDLLKRPEFLVKYGDDRTSLANVAESLLTRGLAFELIKAGFIDRNFTLYTSTFHGDRVSPTATNFIIHHVERNLMDEHFQLNGDDVDAIIRERGTQALSEPALYNIAILDHLLHTGSSSADVMIAALARLDPDARRFLQSYLVAGAAGEELVARLAARSANLLTYLVSDVELDDETRHALVSACLAHQSDRARQRVDKQAKQYLSAHYSDLPVLASPDTDESIAIGLADLFRDAGIAIPDLTPLGKSTRQAFVRLGHYEMNTNNLKAALGDGASLALDSIRESSREYVFAKALAEMPAYLAAIEGHSPSNAGEAGFAAVIRDVFDAAPASIAGMIAAASPEIRVEDLDEVPKETWAALAAGNRFPATFANVAGYLSHAGTVDSAIAVVLAENGTIADVGDAEESDKHDLAVALISASSTLDAALRAKLAESLDLQNYIAASELPAEDGALFPELISRRVVQEGSDTYEHLRGLKWPTLQAVLRVSPTFETWVTPELVAGDLGAVLASDVVSAAAKRAILAQADEYAALGGRDGLLELARCALSLGATVSFSVVELMAANRVAPQQVLALVRPHLKNASDAELFGILNSLGPNYAQLTHVGWDKPKVPNSAASVALLEALKPRGIVASFDPDDDPIKVNKRLK